MVSFISREVSWHSGGSELNFSAKAARDDQPADYTIAVLCADIPLPIEHPEERLIDPTDRSRMACEEWP